MPILDHTYLLESPVAFADLFDLYEKSVRAGRRFGLDSVFGDARPYRRIKRR
jgi:hypothetical protein